MNTKRNKAQQLHTSTKNSQQGAALVIALIIMVLLLGISAAALAIANTETGIAGSDYDRTRTFYAASAGLEKMTNDFSDLFSRKTNASPQDLDDIENAPPGDFTSLGFQFTQSLEVDTVKLNDMQIRQGVLYPFITIPPGGALEGLYAIVTPYKLQTLATSNIGTNVTLQRELNNYQVPLFQFGIFGDKDIELHPGPVFTFNGRVHCNRNLYLRAGTRLTFEDKVTSAQEIVTDTLRNGTSVGGTRTARELYVKAGGFDVRMTQGSVIDSSGVGGPHFNPSQTPDVISGLVYGYFPDSPSGALNTPWSPIATMAATGANDRFGKQVLNHSTNPKVKPLLLPLQLNGSPTRELIKRPMNINNAAVVEDPSLRDSRYYTKAQIRILVDNEGNTGTDSAGIPAGQGVDLSTFHPVPLPLGSDQDGKAIYRVQSGGTYDTSITWRQGTAASSTKAATVRGVGSGAPVNAGTFNIPQGAGLTGRILIQIVAPNGTVRDVTTEILSMGVTVGEPNAIIHLQRPLWSAFVPGSRTRAAGSNLSSLINAVGNFVADGEILANSTTGAPTPPSFHAEGFIQNVKTDDDAGATRYRDNVPPTIPAMPPWTIPANNTLWWNAIVPMNVYNVREGWSAGWPGSSNNNVSDRGLTTVVELNMRNLVKWLDGWYDNNLLAGSNAVSTNVNGAEGYIVYVSDRRGDRIKTEYGSYSSGAPVGPTINATNGIVDNEDIYSNDFAGIPNLDPGEDVIDFNITNGVATTGTLQKDTNELPNPNAPWVQSTGTVNAKLPVAIDILRKPQITYFRRGVRLFDGADLIQNGPRNLFSSTLGITVATENMIYIWGSYNTSGIGAAPPSNSSTKNDGSASGYLGDQVPASIISDAFFPLSKSWFDGLSSLFPQGGRTADVLVAGPGDETSVRAGIISGNNQSAMAGKPDQFSGTDGESRLSGGVHNFPRFLEVWGGRWNFVGSLIPLYYSTQAMGPYNANNTIYSPPTRNWAFDVTFKDPKKLPPGTPMFQYVETTGFRQVISR